MIETSAPQCSTPGCTREAEYDSEPPRGGYFSTCERCVPLSNGLMRHGHRHSYTAEQCAANGMHPGHSWITSTTLRPYVEHDEIAGWECRTSMRPAGGECGYRITRAEVESIRENGTQPPMDVR